MKYIHCDNIDWKKFDSESVLLNLSTGYYFRLNRLGTFVWPLINHDNNVGDIVRMVVEKFDVLMRLCDEIELQLAQSKEESEKLMKAVLQEAFQRKL